MYRVLYRKWRPKTFNDVYGQPHITETLINEVRDNRLAHAYLFTGSRGTGKTSCAKILSKAINCMNPVDGNPCNECEICKGIDSGSVLDVVEIDAASNRGIDDIRALREETAFTPAQTKYRVYIIDEVHMLTIEAFNALLKTLEEPPEHVIFILATTEVQKLPSTILSRCQRFDFGRISVDAIVSRLKFVAEHENVTVDDDASLLIARIADGGMRDALSIFDRCLSISEHVDVNVVTDAAGIMSNDYLFALAHAFKNHDASKALSIVDTLHKSSCDTERLCSELINHFRSLLIIKSVDKPEDILVCTNEELIELKKLSDLFSVEEILNVMNILSAAVASIKVTQNRRIETEMAMIKICSPQSSTDTDSLFARVTALENEISLLKSGNIIKATPVSVADDVKKNDEQKLTEPLSSNSEPVFDDIPVPSDEPVFDDTPVPDDEPVFDDIPVPSDEPVFDDIPVPNDEPVFDDIPVPDDEPVFDDAPVFDSEPLSSSVDFTQEWRKCINEIIRSCPPLNGMINDTNAVLKGKTIEITDYNNIFPSLFQLFKGTIEDSVENVTGQSYSVSIKE